jgi:hypothetical protein
LSERRRRSAPHAQVKDAKAAEDVRSPKRLTKPAFTSRSLNFICIPPPNKDSDRHCSTPINVNYTTTRRPWASHTALDAQQRYYHDRDVSSGHHAHRNRDGRPVSVTIRVRTLRMVRRTTRLSIFEAREVYSDGTRWRAMQCDSKMLPGPLILILRRRRWNDRSNWQAELGRSDN